MWIMNLLAFIVALIATGYLFFVVGKTAKQLRTGFLFLALGVLISLGIHSFAEFLESAGLITADTLVQVMPPLVLVGSILLLIGSVQIYKVISSIRGGVRKK